MAKQYLPILLLIICIKYLMERFAFEMNWLCALKALYF